MRCRKPFSQPHALVSVPSISGGRQPATPIPRALPRLERAPDFCQDGDLTAFFLWWRQPWVPRILLARPVAEAVSLLTEALEQTIARKIVVNQAHCHVSLGEASVVGRLMEVRTLAERALALAHEYQQRIRQAHAALSTAIDLYRAMDMTLRLPQAEAALTQVDGQ
jgi:hypothetical protein